MTLRRQGTSIDKIEYVMHENTHIFIEIINRLITDNIKESKLLNRLTKDELLQLNEYYTQLYEMILEVRNDFPHYFDHDSCNVNGNGNSDFGTLCNGNGN